MKTNLTLLVLLTTSVALTSCTGGGETVVSGFGNSGNFFGVDGKLKCWQKSYRQIPTSLKLTMTTS